MRSLEGQKAARRAIIVENWLGMGNDVEYLITFKESLEHLSNELLREKIEEVQGEVISILPNADRTDEEDHTARIRTQMDRLNENTLQHLTEITAELFILKEALDDREEL
jgi:hypothetical protein